MMKINEVFYSLQGEGLRAGTANVFVRFAECDLACSFCDTEFVSFTEQSETALLDLANAALIAVVGHHVPKRTVGVIFTGGEPALQLTPSLVEAFRDTGWYTAIETNGLHDVSGLGLDWITVSPKTAEHSLKQRTAHEVKYVRHAGQPIPQPTVAADHYLLSPEWGDRTRENLLWCMELVRKNRTPPWRLSVQQHKIWRVR